MKCHCYSLMSAWYWSSWTLILVSVGAHERFCWQTLGVPVRKSRHKLFKLLDSRLQQNVWQGHICDKSEPKGKCGRFIKGTLQNLEKNWEKDSDIQWFDFIYLYIIYIFTPISSTFAKLTNFYAGSPKTVTITMSFFGCTGCIDGCYSQFGTKGVCVIVDATPIRLSASRSVLPSHMKTLRHLNFTTWGSISSPNWREHSTLFQLWNGDSDWMLLLSLTPTTSHLAANCPN